MESKIIYGASLLLFLTGLLDDLKPLSAQIRLLIQLIASCLTVFYAHLSLKSFVLTSNISFTMPAWMGFCLAVLVIMGAINSMNMIDGLDGLASGVLLIGMAILSYFLFLNSRKNELLFIFTVPLLGSLLGFLKYNTHPSIIFMGDSGSNWLGFMIGSFMLIIANKIPTIPFTSILLAFSIPIFDTAHVIALRLIEGKNPMVADNRHFHHSLIKIGFTHSQSVAIIYILMFFFGILGMIPVAFSAYSLGWVSGIGILLLILLLNICVRLKKDFLHNFLTSKFSLHKVRTLKPALSRILYVCDTGHRYTLYALLFTMPLLIIAHPTFIGIMVALAMIFMCVRIFIKNNCSFLEAVLIVMLAAILFSIGNINQIQIEVFSLNIRLHTIYNFLFLWIFLNTILLIGFALRRKFFVITPTDVLLVLFPLLLLMMPDTWKHEYGLRIIMIQSLVLFAGLRLVGKQRPPMQTQ